MRSDAQVKRDELAKTFNEKYNDVSSKTASYLTWPDARLRSYLRASGVDQVPTTRSELLRETRLRWSQANGRVEALMQRIRDAISSGVERTEEQMNSILEMLTGTGDAASQKGKEARYNAAKVASDKAESASAYAKSLSADAAKASKSAKEEL